MPDSEDPAELMYFKLPVVARFGLKFVPPSVDGVGMASDDPIQLELMLNRFRRLIAEMIRGNSRRNAFEPWEIELLLDFQACQVDRRSRSKTLRTYQKAVEHQLETGPGPPMKLSEFLQLRSTRRPKTL